MNSGPYTPPPPDAPPPSPPPPAEPQPGVEPPGPSYYPPPGQPAAAPPRPPRNLGALIAAIVIIVVLLAAIGGYVVGGLAYAQGRINSATDAYNKVVDHQNSLNDTVNSLNGKLSGASTSSSSSSLEQDKATITDIVTKSQTAQSQIDTDDASLAAADSSLKENSWLTILSKSNLDKQSTRIGHARAALAQAKIITADYVQLGTFYESFFDVAIDAETLGTKAQASDISGAIAADEKLKTDTAKAITLDKAPGLPPEIDTYLHDIQAFATDFSTFFNAVSKGDQAAATAAEKALEADGAKVEAFDFTKASNEIDAYYKPLIDAYNSEVDKANAG